MAEQSEDFTVKVTADVTAAGRAFDAIHKQIAAVADDGNAKFAALTRTFGQMNGGAIALAASFTPVGRAGLALVDTITSLVKVGRELAQTLGFGEQFAEFESHITGLGESILTTSAFLLNQGVASARAYHRSVADASGGVTDFERLIARLGATAAGVSNHVRGMIEQFLPEDQRSNVALQAQVDALHSQIEAARRSLLGRLSELAPEMVPERFRRWVSEMEAEFGRLGDLLSSRLELTDHVTLFGPIFSASIEQSIEALRKQNRELEIQAATFGMSAGAAARYRAELEMLRHFSDEDGPRGPVFNQRGPVMQDVIDSIAANRQAAEDRERGQRADRLFTSAEGQTRALEAQANALGATAEATARLTFQERLLQQLRQQRVPIDQAMIERINEMGERHGEAAQRLKDMQRELQFVQEAGRAMSSGLERAFGDWISGAETNWKKFFNTLSRDIGTLALRMYLLQPLFGGGSAGAGLLGRLLGFGGGGDPAARADGGPVLPGMPYLVGERGPELFLPDASGTIVPNGVGGTTTINMRVDLAGANGDETIARISAQAARAAAAAAVQQSNEMFPARQRKLHMLGS